MDCKRLTLPALVLALAAFLSGCGGASAPSVSVKASSSTVDGTDTITLTATVNHDKNAAGVKWSVSGGGALSSETTSSATYTAPAATPSAQNITILATSIADSTKSASAAITVPAAPAITTTDAGLASSVGSTYKVTLAGSGGITPYTWTLSSGALPSCLSLTSAGVISGTVTAQCAGTFTPTFTMTDSGTPTALKATQQLTMTISAAPAIAFTGNVPGTGTYNVAYSASVMATGGAGTLAYVLATDSTLPTGVSLNSTTGAISGTPTTVGTYTFAVKASDAYGDSATSSTYTLVVSYPAMSVTTATLPVGYVGSAYASTALAATGGAGNAAHYSWAVATGSALPAGLSLSTAGVISGTPIGSAGTSDVTVTVTDSVSSLSANATLALQVKAGVTITEMTLPTGYVGSAYTATQLTATGGSGTYSTWELTSGSSLPAGLALSTAGAISGTPTGSPATTNFTVKVTDSASNTATASFSITVQAGVTITTSTSLPDGYPETIYSSITLAATGGTGSYASWAVTSGALPAGITLNNAGVLSGTPTTAGSYSFAIKVTDSASNSATATFSLTVESVLAVSTTTLPSAAVNNSYSQKLAATGGSGGYTWTVSGSATNTLSTYNLSLASDGTISGTPTATGTASFTAVVTDSTSHTASQAFNIVVSTLVISTGTLNTGVTGSPYSQTLSASGGSGTYTWSVTSGASDLTALGLGVTSAGMLTSGGNALTAAGSATFTVQVTDTNSATATATATYTVHVYQALEFTTTALNSAIYNETYSGTINATGGSGSYTWTVNSSSIPTTGTATTLMNGGGLTGSNTGNGTLTLGGTATSYGTITLSVQVTDSVTSQSVTNSYTIAVNSLTVSVDAASVPQGMVNMPYLFGNVTIQNGTSPYTIAYSNSPDGLTGNSNGQLVGVPTAAGTTTVTVTVTDSSSPTNQIGTATFSVPVVAQTTGTNDSELSGQYACYLARYWDSGVTGGNGTSKLYRGGLVFAFTANGGGTITGSEVDSNSPSSGHKLVSSLTGTYEIGADNRGFIDLGNGQLIVSVAGSNLSNSVFTELALTEMDDAGSSPSGQHGAGHCYKQTTASLSGVRPSGGYVFGMSGEDSSGNTESAVGQVTFSGTSATGIQDSVDGTGTSFGDTFSNTTSTTDSFGRMVVSQSGTNEMVFYVTNDSKGDALMMTMPDHSGTSNADFLIGQARAQSSTAIAASHPINGNAVMYLSGPVNASGSTTAYKALAAQVSGSTSANKITINSIAKNNAGAFSLDTDNMYGKSAGYTTDTSTGRTTLNGVTGDYFYLYNTNAAVVLFADTGSNGGTNGQIGWLEPQTASGSWTLSSMATSYATLKVPNGDYETDLSDGVLTMSSTGAISNFASDSGGMLWASWDEGVSGSSSATATGALSLNSSDGASYGLLDVNITSGGSTQSVSACYAISVDTSTTSTAKGRLVCIDTSSEHPTLMVIQE